MSDISPSLEDVDLLLNGGVPLNKLNYIRKQAISADVLFTLAIRNSLLIRWSHFLQDWTNIVDLLNLMIPNGALKIDRTSERTTEVKKQRLGGGEGKAISRATELLLAAMLSFSFRDDVTVLIQWRARISLV